MVFDSITKSLKGVTTTLSDTVSDGFDTLTAPISALSDTITGNHPAWTVLTEQARHDQYTHWWIQATKKLLEDKNWSGLATTKYAGFETLLKWVIAQGFEAGRKQRSTEHVKQLQTIRKQLKDSKLIVVSTDSATLSDKVTTLPSKSTPQLVTSFEEFIMNCQQSLREIETSEVRIALPHKQFSLDSNKEAIRTYSKTIVKKSFGIIGDHGKIASLSHQVVKHLKKIESLMELQATAFDGESKRYTTEIAQVEKELTALYAGEWKKSLQTLQEGYTLITTTSESIHKEWLTVLAHGNEYFSTLITDQKKQEKNLFTDIKTRTKKIQLLTKKLASSTRKVTVLHKELDTVGKSNEKIITSQWKKRQEKYTNLFALTDTTRTTLSATGLWQEHLTRGYISYLLQGMYAKQELLKRTSHIGNHVESEYSLTQDLLKKLVRDLRKQHADIVSQQSTNTQSEAFVTDLNSFILRGENQIKQLKTRKNESKKQTTQQKHESSTLTTKAKELDRSGTLTIEELQIQVHQLFENHLKTVVDHKTALSKELQELGSNKKLTLAKTETHEPIWYEMRVLSDTLKNEIDHSNDLIERSTDKKEKLLANQKKRSKKNTSSLIKRTSLLPKS